MKFSKTSRERFPAASSPTSRRSAVNGAAMIKWRMGRAVRSDDRKGASTYTG
jgi:hypothetical protein